MGATAEVDCGDRNNSYGSALSPPCFSNREFSLRQAATQHAVFSQTASMFPSLAAVDFLFPVSSFFHCVCEILRVYIYFLQQESPLSDCRPLVLPRFFFFFVITFFPRNAAGATGRLAPWATATTRTAPCPRKSTLRSAASPRSVSFGCSFSCGGLLLRLLFVGWYC